MDNVQAEGFIGRPLDECFSGNWFLNLADARDIVEAWRQDYNCVRPHSSPGGIVRRAYTQTTTALQFALVSTVG
jgi:putative transposase